MKKGKPVYILVLILLVAALVLCCVLRLNQRDAEPAPAPTNIPVSWPEPVPEASPEPVPAVSPEPSPEPAPESTPEPTPEPEPEPTPDPVAEELKVTAGLGGGSSPVLTDGNLNTKSDVPQGSTLVIKSEEPMYSLSLGWYSDPGEYTLSFNDSSITRTSSFMMDYIELGQPATEIQLTVADKYKYLCEVRAFSQGTAPEDVQVWEEPSSDCDVLFFPTHADDDVLFFGALMAQCIDQGLDIQVSFFARHPMEPIREHERLAGLWASGVRHYPTFAGFEDVRAGSVEEAGSIFGTDKVITWQVESIRRFKPEVIVGHDPEGEYGNNIHKLNTKCLFTAFDAAADDGQYTASAEEYGPWQAQKMYLHLYKERQFALDIDAPLAHYNGMTAFEVAQAGFACHKSQIQWDYKVCREDSETMDCRLFGLALTLVGDDTGTDIMEHTTK